MSELEFDEKVWLENYEKLPPGRKKGLERWFATQALIIHNLGIEEEKWFGLIWWALENPLDFSFIEEFPEGGGPSQKVEKGPQEGAAARRFLGADGEKKQVATGGDGVRKSATKGGLDQELYQRFMANQMRQGPPGARPRPRAAEPTRDKAAKPRRPGRPGPRRGR